MSALSRRKLLQTGGAAAGAVVIAGPLTHASAAGPKASNVVAAPAEALAPTGVDQMVMYVKNTGKGEVAILTDGHEVVFHDPELVARVQRAANKARS